MRKHRWGRQLLVVLCVLLTVFLAGCRPSPVLEQIIYEQNHEVNPDTETKTMDDDPENEEPDEDIPSRETVDDSEQEKDQEYTAALAGDVDTDIDAQLDAVYDVVYDSSGELSEPDEANPTADSAAEKETGSTEVGGDEGGYAASGEGQDSDTEGVSGDELTDGGNGELGGEPDSGTGYEPSKERVMKQYVDPSGQAWTVPESVDTVTAVGEAATIVEMLGGSGRLVGTSSSFTGSDWVRSVFDLDGVNTWWDDDGSSVCDNYNFDALLAANPDVCFEISGDKTFSEAQIAALTENDIGYVVLPKLSSIANIESAVTIVGQVLGNRLSDGLTNAEDIASSYCSWAENTINQVKGRSYSAKLTTYIGRWDYEAYWQLQSLQSGGLLAGGYGVPVGMQYQDASPLAECMGYANLTNTAADNRYVEPVYRLGWEPTITGGSGKYSDGYRVGTVYSEELQIGLGADAFPAVIVENSSIKENICNNDNNYYNYHWQPGTTFSYRGGYYYGIPLVDGTYIATYIQGDYEILVNPSGVGNWAKGSVESPMEAVWLACKFQDLNVDLNSMVAGFYSTFYHYNGNTASVLGE